jgi:hypothetical protein
MPRRWQSGTSHNDRYGWHHRMERAKWAEVVALGGCLCVRCNEPITADEPWDLDHADDGVTYNGPAHQGCNRAAGARRREALRTGLPAGRGYDPSGGLGHTGGPDDPRRDADGVLRRTWGEW